MIIGNIHVAEIDDEVIEMIRYAGRGKYKSSEGWVALNKAVLLSLLRRRVRSMHDEGLIRSVSFRRQ